MSSFPNDPFLVYKRLGTKDSPFLQYDEPKQVYGGKVVLTEIPDKGNHVNVKDSNNVSYAEVTSQASLSANNVYYVDYDRGIVYFDSSKEGLTFTFSYLGIGGSYVPATRVYTQSANGTVTQDVQDMIDNYNQLNGTDLYNLFDPQTGHKHTGGAGDAPPIDSQYVTYDNGSGTVSKVKDTLDSHTAQLADIAIDVKYPPAPLVSCKGDGVTDDSQAIQSIINYCKTNGYRLFADDSNYYIKSPVDFSDLDKIDFRGTIIVSASMTNTVAVKLGSSTTTCMTNADIKIGVVNETYKNWSSGVTGLQITNVYHSRLLITKVTDFTVGSLFIGDDQGTGVDTGFAYNMVTYESFNNNQTNMILQPNGTKGYVNENMFIGTQNSGATTGVQIGTSLNTNPDACNHNMFLRGSMEGCSTAIHVIAGDYNYFLDQRFEGTTTQAVFETNSNYNFVEVGYKEAIVFTDNSPSQSNFVYKPNDKITRLPIQPMVDFQNATLINTNLIVPGCSMRSFSDSNIYSMVSNATGQGVTFDNVKKTLTLPHYTAVGVEIDTSTIKRMQLSFNADGNAVFVFIPFDANGNRLLNDKNYVNVSNYVGTDLISYRSTDYGGCYKNTLGSQSPSDIMELFVTSEVQKLWVGVAGHDSVTKTVVSGFSIFTKNASRVSSVLPTTQSGVALYKSKKYASSIPTTGTWNVGDIVYNYTPTAGGNIGWVCVTAGTPGTWKTFGTIGT